MLEPMHPTHDTAFEKPVQAEQAALDALRATGQLRRCRVVEPIAGGGNAVHVAGSPAINFSGNDYLGLSRDARLKTAAIGAIERYGVGSGASRLISGTTSLTEALEADLARFKQTEAALVFNSGYQANVAILQALLKPGDWVHGDKLNHASLVDGCRLSGASWSRYRHLDWEHLDRNLRKAPPGSNQWIVTDSVFSMDGDYPDLPALVALAERYQARILVDEAHATGIYGPQRSSGLCEAQGMSDRIALQMGTFSKALGGAGAYVAGNRALINLLINRARGFVYSTALPPSVIASARCAVAIVQSDTTLKAKLWENVNHFQALAAGTPLAKKMPSVLQSPIVPVRIGESAQAVELSEKLLSAGYFVQGIRPPTVSPGTARLRITLNAAHRAPEIEGLIHALNALLD